MTTQHVTPCGTAHDPEPWLTYVMQTGSAGGWSGRPKFIPRAGYCQELDCYRAPCLCEPCNPNDFPPPPLP